jgi:hypothetical protein
LYRAPSRNFNQFLTGSDATLKYLYNPKSEFLISGDINMGYLNEKKKRTNLTKTTINNI